MEIAAYEKQFEDILEGRNKNYPYDSEAYVTYVKLNQARMNRWTKVGKISPDLVETIQQIEQPQNWILITEPWCGDAAHSHAFIKKMAELNPAISLTIQNRDDNSEIDDYLTNGGKAIPKLIVRDAEGKDIFNWGPRPSEAQAMALRHKVEVTTSAEDKKKELQVWYNKDKGKAIQQEFNALLKEHGELASK